jgi:ankyrin repeat protein
MKGKKPIRSRIRKAFLTVATAIVGLGGGAGIATLNNNSDKAPTEITSTYNPNALPDFRSLYNYNFNFNTDYGTQLISAAERGDVINVYSLLGNPIDQADKNLAMEAAAYNGHENVVNALLQDGVLVSNNNWAAFTAAVDGTYTDLASHIAGFSKPSAEVINENMLTAVQQGNFGMTKMLVKDQGADVSYKNDLALLLSVQSGNADIVQLILAQQHVTIAPPYTRIYDFDKFNGDFYDEHTPPFHGSLRLEHGYGWRYDFQTPQFADVFTRAAANVDANQGAALYAAVENYDVKIARMLLDAGANVNANNGAALMKAVESGDALMAKLLLSYHANPDLQNGAIRNLVEKSDDPTMQSVFSNKGPGNSFSVPNR